jgi:hypothetical protein
MSRWLSIALHIAFIAAALAAAILLPNFRIFWLPDADRPLSFAELALARFIFIYVASGILPFLLWKYGHLIRISRSLYSFIVWGVMMVGATYMVSVYELKQAERHITQSIVDGKVTGPVRLALMQQIMTTCMNLPSAQKEKNPAEFCRCGTDAMVDLLFGKWDEDAATHNKKISQVGSVCHDKLAKSSAQ